MILTGSPAMRYATGDLHNGAKRDIGASAFLAAASQMAASVAGTEAPRMTGHPADGSTRESDEHTLHAP